MKFSLLQLNIWQGAFLPTVIDYLTHHDFSVIQLQEVSGGVFSTGGAYKMPGLQDSPLNPITLGIDSKKELERAFSQYRLIEARTTRIIGDTESYNSNVTLIKNDISVTQAEILWLEHYYEYKALEDFAPSISPRNALIVKANILGQQIEFINTHLPWGPNPLDTRYKVAQAQKLYDYIAHLSVPFVLTGDFNATPETKRVTMFEALGKNLVKEYAVTNTLNPRLHKAKQLFPQGLAVDYIFTSRLLNVTNFSLIDAPDMSDHLGLMIEIDL